jgi:uncharacterized protein YndB with AHSA1/START domain
MRADGNTASIHIAATPAEIFEYFVRPESFVQWMGQFAQLDARPGGQFAVNIEGVPVRGEYLVVEPPHRVVVTWGHAGSERFPPGSSRVEVTLTADRGGTTVTIVHKGLPDELVHRNAAGWVRYLSQLAAATAGAQSPRHRA